MRRIITTSAPSIASSKCLLDSQSAFDQLGKLVRHERAWTTDTDVRAEFCEQVDVRTRDARVQNVADDRDFQSFDPAFVFANRQRIEQRLRWMFVRAVAGIDDWRVASCARDVAARRPSSDE